MEKWAVSTSESFKFVVGVICLIKTVLLEIRSEISA